MFDKQSIRALRNIHKVTLAPIKELIIERLSNSIREYRFKNDEMTQKELAGQVGVSRQTINAIENGRHAPTVSVAIRIADAFGVTVDQLFELDYEGKPATLVHLSRVATDQSRTAAEKTNTVESRYEPAKAEPVREVSLASLRNVIG